MSEKDSRGNSKRLRFEGGLQQTVCEDQLRLPVA